MRHADGCEHQLAEQLKKDLEKQGARDSQLLPPSQQEMLIKELAREESQHAKMQEHGYRERQRQSRELSRRKQHRKTNQHQRHLRQRMQEQQKLVGEFQQQYQLSRAGSSVPDDLSADLSQRSKSSNVSHTSRKSNIEAIKQKMERLRSEENMRMT